ncbi:MAG: helix-turn-helix transcriptional regulator [Bacteroides sp.]|nr:helix-turn-helix transcriptional regulator [Bacteroides sp.]
MRTSTQLLIEACGSIASHISAKAELEVIEDDGLIIRKAYATVPPKVEYTLSASGASLIPIVVGLYKWAKDNMSDIKADRVKYQSRNHS